MQYGEPQIERGTTSDGTISLARLNDQDCYFHRSFVVAQTQKDQPDNQGNVYINMATIVMLFQL